MPPLTPGPAGDQSRKDKDDADARGAYAQAISRARKLRSRKPGKTKPPKPKAPKAKAPARPKPIDPWENLISAAVSQKYGDAEKQLGQQVVANAQRGTNVGSWFAEYQQALRDANVRTQQAAQAAQTQIGALQNASSTLDASQNAGLQAQMQTDAASRGATVDPSTAQTGQQASTVRRAMTDSFGAMLANQQAQDQKVGELGGSYAAAQKVSELVKNSDALKAILGQQGDLAEDKGAFRVTYRKDLEDAAHKQSLEDAAFGLKRDEPNEYGYTDAQWAAMTPDQRQKVVKSFAAAKRPPAQKKTPTVNAYGYTAEAWAKKTTAQRRKIMAQGKPGAKKPAGKKPKSPWAAAGAQGSAADQIAKAVEYAKGYAAQKAPRQQVASNLLKGVPADSKSGTAGVPAQKKLWLSVALDIAYDGHISRRNVELLHKRGIKVKDLGYPTRPKPAAQKVGDVVSSVGDAIAGIVN